MAMSLNTLNSATRTMTNTFNSAESIMSRSLERISSGKRVNRASDDFSAFQKVLNLSIDKKTYERRGNDMTELSSVINQAIDTSNAVIEDLTNMKAAWSDAEAFTDGTPEDLAAKDLAAGYQATITEALKMTSTDGKTLIDNSATWATTTMAGGSTLTIALDGETLATGSEATAAATQTSIDNMVSYVGKLQEYQATLDSQSRLSDIMVSNSDAVSSAINSVDEAEEMANYVDADIRQQAAVSMVSQANMSRRNISLLYR